MGNLQTLKKKPSVSIIIITSNALDLTREQLGYVSGLNVGKIKAECILVDNGSTDNTKSEMENFRLPNMEYKYLRNNSNLGFTGGNNIAIKDALARKFDYVLLMNNDLILPHDLAVKLVSFMENNPKAGLASPKMYFAKGYEFHKGRYKNSERGKVIWYAGGIIDKENVYTTHRGVDEIDGGQYDETIETDVANGACVIIRQGVFKTIGYLDDSLFLYWEDADFCERARLAGFKVFYYPGAWIWHKVSSSAGGSGSGTNDYFLTRNRYYYSLKYSTLRTRIAVMRDTLRLVFMGRKWQRIGALDALIGRKGIGRWIKE